MKYYNSGTTAQFIEKAQAKHGNRYDYSKAEYVRSKDKLIILCPQHGEFLQQPFNHLAGNGCPGCKNVITINTFTIGKEGYLIKFRQVHGDRYAYDKVPSQFKGRQKIEIDCALHGSFLKTASEHANGVGCPKCGAKLRASNSAGWTRSK